MSPVTNRKLIIDALKMISKEADDEDLINATLYHKIFDVGYDECVIYIPEKMKDHVESLKLGIKIEIDNNIPEGHWYLRGKGK